MHPVKKIILTLLPHKLATKLCFIRHILTEKRQTPFCFPHSEKFSGKLPDDWQRLLLCIEKASQKEAGEFFRRLKNEELLCYDTSMLNCLRHRDFALSPVKSDELIAVPEV